MFLEPFLRGYSPNSVYTGGVLAVSLMGGGCRNQVRPALLGDSDYQKHIPVVKRGVASSNAEKHDENGKQIKISGISQPSQPSQPAKPASQASQPSQQSQMEEKITVWGLAQVSFCDFRAQRLPRWTHVGGRLEFSNACIFVLLLFVSFFFLFFLRGDVEIESTLAQ